MLHHQTPIEISWAGNTKKKWRLIEVPSNKNLPTNMHLIGTYYFQIIRSFRLHATLMCALNEPAIIQTVPTEKKTCVMRYNKFNWFAVDSRLIWIQTAMPGKIVYNWIGIREESLSVRAREPQIEGEQYVKL